MVGGDQGTNEGRKTLIAFDQDFVILPSAGKEKKPEKTKKKTTKKKKKKKE